MRRYDNEVKVCGITNEEISLHKEKNLQQGKRPKIVQKIYIKT